MTASLVASIARGHNQSLLTLTLCIPLMILLNLRWLLLMLATIPPSTRLGNRLETCGDELKMIFLSFVWWLIISPPTSPITTHTHFLSQECFQWLILLWIIASNFFYSWGFQSMSRAIVSTIKFILPFFCFPPWCTSKHHLAKILVDCWFVVKSSLPSTITTSLGPSIFNNWSKM